MTDAQKETKNPYLVVIKNAPGAIGEWKSNFLESGTLRTPQESQNYTRYLKGVLPVHLRCFLHLSLWAEIRTCPNDPEIYLFVANICHIRIFLKAPPNS